MLTIAGHNGFHHNERNWWNKNTLFERSCRMPLIIVAPGAERGAACRGLVELVDFYPTVADYCGVKPPRKLAGRSLRPLLENPAMKGREGAFTLVTRGGSRYGQTVRTDRWRFAQWSDGNVELSDELKDPEETRDVSGNPQHAALIQELKSHLTKIGRPKAEDTPPARSKKRNASSKS